MASPAHEIAVTRLGQDPSLLPDLAEKLLGRPPPRALRPVDSTLRLANPAEVRPDLILAAGKRGPWDAVEVQRRRDRGKERRWPVLVSLLQDQRGCMGDLWVITCSPRVAAWARAACDAQGAHGTRMRLEPAVLEISAAQVEALLDEGRPSLAFFAAWAMQDRHGAKAEAVVERALAITDRLPTPLRRQQERDIVSVLNGRMVHKLKEKIMDATRNLESRWMRELREELSAIARVEGRAEGKREALLVVLEARKLRPSAKQRAVIRKCSDPTMLDRWLADAATAASIDTLLASAPPPRRRSASVGAPARARG